MNKWWQNTYYIHTCRVSAIPLLQEIAIQNYRYWISSIVSLYWHKSYKILWLINISCIIKNCPPNFFKAVNQLTFINENWYFLCLIAGQPIVVFRTDKKTSADQDETYRGSLTNFDELYKWVQEKCIPLVREITFENAEELTEEGLPFLILFHDPKDTESVKKYKEIIKRDLIAEKRKFTM